MVDRAITQSKKAGDMANIDNKTVDFRDGKPSLNTGAINGGRGAEFEALRRGAEVLRLSSRLEKDGLGTPGRVDATPKGESLDQIQGPQVKDA